MCSQFHVSLQVSLCSWLVRGLKISVIDWFSKSSFFTLEVNEWVSISIRLKRMSIWVVESIPCWCMLGWGNIKWFQHSKVVVFKISNNIQLATHFRMGSWHFSVNMSAYEIKMDLLAFQRILKCINRNPGAQVISVLLKHCWAEFSIWATSEIDEFWRLWSALGQL